MNDRDCAIFSVVTGALIGGLVGFLLLTDRGKSIRDEFLPRLEEVTEELRGLQETAVRVRAMTAVAGPTQRERHSYQIPIVRMFRPE